MLTRKGVTKAGKVVVSPAAGCKNMEQMGKTFWFCTVF